MIAKEYSAGLMSQSFWFIEFKKVIRLLSNGSSREEAKALCIQNHLFGVNNDYRAKRIAGYLMGRTSALGKAEIELFMRSDLATQKLLNLIAILRTDRLFFEFLFEVYREKAILGETEITDGDARIFFQHKEIQSPVVEGWKDTTKVKLRQCYFNFMTDANLLAANGKTHQITPPVLETDLERHLKAKGDSAIMQAIAGVRG